MITLIIARLSHDSILAMQIKIAKLFLLTRRSLET